MPYIIIYISVVRALFNLINHIYYFSFYRQGFAFTIFFMFAMVAFVLRHHGAKVPECEEGDDHIANFTANLTDMLEYGTTLPTFDTGTVEILDSSEVDDVANGFTNNPGKRIYIIFKD